MAEKTPAIQPLQKTNIRGITNHLVTAITDMGLNVWISFSKYSKSRYLEVHIRKRVYIIRISDHSLFKGRFDYDVYTDRPRRGAKSYLAFLELFREQVKAQAR